MQIIGLTGGIATGKTTAAEHIKSRGITVVSADAIARHVLEANIARIGKRFPEAMISGEVDRQRLGEIVFADARRRRQLNKIVHPGIIARMLLLIVYYYCAGHSRIVLDAPLLFESKADRFLSFTLVIACSQDSQLERVMARDKLPKQQARARIQAQMPLGKKMQRASFVLMNDLSPTSLCSELDSLLEATAPSRLVHFLYWAPVPLALILAIFGLIKLAMRLTK